MLDWFREVEGRMNTTIQYTTFVGDINGLNEELKKAAKINKKPILLSSEIRVDEKLKSKHTFYTVVFEQTVIAS